MEEIQRAKSEPSVPAARKPKTKLRHTRRTRTLSSEVYQEPFIWYLVRWYKNGDIHQRGFSSQASAEKFMLQVVPKLTAHKVFSDVDFWAAKFSDSLSPLGAMAGRKSIRYGRTTYRFRVRWKIRRTAKCHGFDSEEDARRFHRHVWEFERHATGFYLYPSIYMRLC